MPPALRSYRVEADGPPGPRSAAMEQCEASGVLVAVRDSGPGIDPGHSDRVFDAFYTTKSSGVGMGLSICRSIINAHGGRLWADVNASGGALFQFTLAGAGKELTRPAAHFASTQPPFGTLMPQSGRRPHGVIAGASRP